MSDAEINPSNTNFELEEKQRFWKLSQCQLKTFIFNVYFLLEDVEISTTWLKDSRIHCLNTIVAIEFLDEIPIHYLETVLHKHLVMQLQWYVSFFLKTFWHSTQVPMIQLY